MNLKNTFWILLFFASIVMSSEDAKKEIVKVENKPRKLEAKRPDHLVLPNGDLGQDELSVPRVCRTPHNPPIKPNWE